MNIDFSNNRVFNRKNIIEGVGWIGSAMVLSAYIIPFNEEVDAIFNVLGSAGLATIAFYKKAYPPVMVNTIWILGAIVKYIFKYK